ncbi:hypothetical protein, no similarity [Geotrichum candidum]|uniref:Uncharacterized protein n=2 Tax=Geotrichum candidum TaxID=1173061 RepID=A0A0J9XFS9_GEOCN|nr:hypothetical protein, no similarity [Geotrichum candidum]
MFNNWSTMNAHNQVFSPAFVKRPLQPCAPQSFNSAQTPATAPGFCSKLQLQLQQSQATTNHSQQQDSSAVVASSAVSHRLCPVEHTAVNTDNSKLTFVCCPKPSRKALFNKVAAYNHTPPPSRFMTKVEDEEDDEDDLYDDEDDYSDEDDEDQDYDDYKSRDDDGVFLSD